MVRSPMIFRFSTAATTRRACGRIISSSALRPTTCETCTQRTAKLDPLLSMLARLAASMAIRSMRRIPPCSRTDTAGVEPATVNELGSDDPKPAEDDRDRLSKTGDVACGSRTAHVQCLLQPTILGEIRPYRGDVEVRVQGEPVGVLHGDPVAELQPRITHKWNVLKRRLWVLQLRAQILCEVV